MTNGKGSKPRPLSVPFDAFASNWERIFAPKEETSAISVPHTNTQTPQKKKRKSYEPMQR